MMDFRIPFLSLLLSTSSLVSFSQEPADTLLDSYTLDEVVVRQDGIRKMKYGAGNTEIITAAELTRAACCNLGESFTTNPSVDVSYTDAATGAKQIRLLGLAGTYVQMLTENVPNFRGAASPYSLGYIAGPWMQSIQVSKGASSVKNGYESVSGQINVEMKKPQLDPSLSINAYADHEGKAEVNAAGNLHFGKKWSGGLLLHGENSFKTHDGNGDGFIDSPKVRQLAAMNRWAYLSSSYVFQLAMKFLAEKRESGQDDHHSRHLSQPLYKINIDTRRFEVFTKNAFMFDRDNDGNIALILSGIFHNQDADYGMKLYDVDQTELYASLMFERKWNDINSLSTGLSLNHDRLNQHYLLTPPQAQSVPSELLEKETVGGAYAQYTFNLDGHLVAMGGLRYDYSSIHGSLFTPRLHVRYNPSEQFSFNVSAGKGYRSPHPLADLNYLLASSRTLVIERNLPMESAWNFGASASLEKSVWNRKFSISAEYYYTDFRHQLCVNFDRDPHAVYIYDLKGKSHSHTFQAELTAGIIADMTLTAAYRLTDVKSDYGFGMEEKPLISKSKGLITLNYAPMMGKWQFDATLSINGGGRMPTPYVRDNGLLSWSPRFSTYCTLNLQATRSFRHWSVYVGGENVTGYRQKNPIIDAGNPWGKDFDATMIYGPLHGSIFYVGFRYNITKY